MDKDFKGHLFWSTVLEAYYHCWAMKLSWLDEPQIITGNVSGFEFVWLKQTKTWCWCTIKFTILSTKAQTFPRAGGSPPLTHTPTRRSAPRHICVQRLTPSYAQVHGELLVWREFKPYKRFSFLPLARNVTVSPCSVLGDSRYGFGVILIRIIVVFSHNRTKFAVLDYL